MGKDDREWYEITNDIVMTGTLRLSELECPCCKRVMVSPHIYNIAAEVKYQYGEEIIITSCYRCALHNLYVKGVEKSKHMLGEAIDLQPRNKRDNDLTQRIDERYSKQYKVIRYKDENYLHIQTR